MSGAGAVPVYPVFLRLDGERVVVVGGGAVAAGKLDGLLAAGARVTVIAPVISDGCRRPGVEKHERSFFSGDLDGARFVVAAATPEVNRAVAEAARARGLFVNAVDDRAAATAFLGGVVRRGDVTIAISTGGAAPALAGLLREAIAAVVPDDVQGWVETAAAERARWRDTATPFELRREKLFAALAAARARAAAARGEPAGLLHEGAA